VASSDNSETDGNRPSLAAAVLKDRNIRVKVCLPLFLALLLLGPLWSSLTSPQFTALRAIDLFRMVGIGICLAASTATVVLFAKRRA
jgi:hypothetical protein